MWFASLFSNEALISISTVQLLHFSHLDFACTSPGSGLPARTVWREKSGQPKKLIPASPSRALPNGWEHSQDTWRMCCLDAAMAPAMLWSFTAPWEGGDLVQAAQNTELTGWDCRHTQHTQGFPSAQCGRAQLKQTPELRDSLLIWEDRSHYGNALGYTQFSD